MRFKRNSYNIMKEREAKVELVVYEIGITNIYSQELTFKMTVKDETDQ